MKTLLTLIVLIIGASGALAQQTNNCPAQPFDPWDHYNRPEAYVTSDATVSAVSPCYLDVQLSNGQTWQFIFDQTLAPLTVGQSVTVNFSLTTGALGFLKYDGGSN